MTYDEQHDDPTTSWAYVVGAVGCLLFVVAVYFANGVYFQLAEGSKAESSAAGPSLLLRNTWGAQTTILNGSANRVDIETDKTYPTQPIGDAMKRVQAQLKKTQGT